MTVLPLAGRKIAHLTTVDLSLEYLLLPQLVAARDAGAEVIGISAPGPSVARLEAEGIRHVPLQNSTREFSLRSDVAAMAELRQILRRERPEILHTHNPKPGLYGRVIGRLSRVPVIVNTVHGLYATEDDRLLKRSVVYGLESIAGLFSNAELFQNEEDLDLLRRLRLVRRDRSSLLGNGVDLERFDAAKVAPSAVASLRESFGAITTDVVVGIVGRLVKEKGYGELIAAAEMVQSPVRIVAVGGRDAEKADSVDESLLDRGRAAGIKFLGHRQDVRELYAAMDVVVLPSYREGLPRGLMEAAAMAKPLIATNIRGCRQVVADGENGRLIEPRSAEALADAIDELASSEHLRSRWGQASRARAERLFSESQVVDKVLRVYVKGLGGPSASAAVTL